MISWPHFSRKLFLLGLITMSLTVLYQMSKHTLFKNSVIQRPPVRTDYEGCLSEQALAHRPPTRKAKAAFVILIRNNELKKIVKSIQNLEARFNSRFHYPYVFLNDEPFSEEFETTIYDLIQDANVYFGTIPRKMWGYPSWVNETLAAECRQQMHNQGVMYGSMESYHHMCRFQSGFFFDHPLLDDFDWYWRVEPGVTYFCDITYDPFLYMEKHGYKYGFVITLQEMRDTIPTLWSTVLDYARSRQIDISMETSNLLFPYFVDQETGDYNLCHFWSNFEIASLNLWRSEGYRDFFKYLDDTGNFFYERWGDAPVHSLGAGLFLSTDEVHYFEDIGYQHDTYRHCPDKNSGLRCRCDCPERSTRSSIDHDHYHDTCLPVWRAWTQEVEDRKLLQ